MMVKRKLGGRFFVAAAILASLVMSCSKSDSDGTTGTTTEPTTTTNYKWFVSAQLGDYSYFLTQDSVNSGSLSLSGNGIEQSLTYSHYVFNGNDAVLALKYGGGSAGLGVIYGLNSSGNLAAIGGGFSIANGFTSLGAYSHYILTTKSGATVATATGSTDSTIGALFYFIDLNRNGAVTSNSIPTINMLGDGSTATLVGIVDAGDGTFLSAASSSTNPDSCYVVKMDSNLVVKNIIKTGKIGYSYGQWRSARYSMIANSGDGDTYVFSSPISTTKKNPAGVMRIKKGATSFDDSYYYNLESNSANTERLLFRKVFAVSDDYFLLEFYNATAPGNTSPANTYAIFNGATGVLTWITGLPAAANIKQLDGGASGVGWPFSTGGKMYLPVTATTGDPVIYNVDPTTGLATPGLTIVGADFVPSVGLLSY